MTRGWCNSCGFRLGLLKNADWMDRERRYVTHRLVEDKEIYLRPLCPHKRS